MKPALQFRLHQQLTLTPQLQLAIRLLQLSQLELEAELRQLAEGNPLLEFAEENEDEAGAGETAPETDYAPPSGPAEAAANDVADRDEGGDWSDDGGGSVETPIAFLQRQRQQPRAALRRQRAARAHQGQQGSRQCRTAEESPPVHATACLQKVRPRVATGPAARQCGAGFMHTGLRTLEKRMAQGTRRVSCSACRGAPITARHGCRTNCHALPRTHHACLPGGQSPGTGETPCKALLTATPAEAGGS